MLNLAREHPEFLAAVSIHPARKDAADELEKCLAGGAAALKCLPNVQGIDWNDRFRFPTAPEIFPRNQGQGNPLIPGSNGGNSRTSPQRKSSRQGLLRSLLGGYRQDRNRDRLLAARKGTEWR